jgi:hypothetical protein
LSQDALNCYLSFHLNVGSAAQLRSSLEQCFAEGIGAIVCLEANGDGHAVIGYEIVDTGNGNFNVLLCNPNVPFTPSEDSSSSIRATIAAESVLSVTSGGTWTLQHSDLFLANGSPIWTGGIGSMTVMPGKAIGVQPTFPWAEMIAGALLVGGLVVWFVGGDASVSQVSDGLGHTLLANGQLNQDATTMLQGVRRMPNLGRFGQGASARFCEQPVRGAYPYHHWNGSRRLPAQIASGETHTFAPGWSQLSTGAGTVQIRTAAGALSTNAIK